MSLNKILLIGNLRTDPEVHFTAAGKAVASFPLATNRRFKNEGEGKQETEWFQVVCFGRLAEISGEFLSKGRSVFVEGRVKTQKWEDAEGGKHYRTEVIAEALTLIGKPSAEPKDDESGGAG